MHMHVLKRRLESSACEPADLVRNVGADNLRLILFSAYSALETPD
jgi:hypothetical protein